MFCPPKNQELQLAITGPLAAHSLVEKNMASPSGVREIQALRTAVEKKGSETLLGKDMGCIL